MPLVKHINGDFYCYAEDAGKAAWAYGPLHHSEIPATAADAMEILDAQDRERMEEDGAWLYDEVIANRAFGVDYPAPEEQTANLKLAAAAPAMLSALQELVNWFGDVRDDWAGWDGVNEVLDQANAAIAKATTEHTGEAHDDRYYDKHIHPDNCDESCDSYPCELCPGCDGCEVKS